jgi:hypothetical protein
MMHLLRDQVFALELLESSQITVMPTDDTLEQPRLIAFVVGAIQQRAIAAADQFFELQAVQLT